PCGRTRHERTAVIAAKEKNYYHHGFSLHGLANCDHHAKIRWSRQKVYLNALWEVFDEEIWVFFISSLFDNALVSGRCACSSGRQTNIGC
ncbi:MAG: hypothetical protein Q8938_18725, partial [Bacteroidota bacterium]|nr:hypothetical protein [Bacteroidota bacterium]